MNWAPLYASNEYIANTPTYKLTQNYHIEAKYAGFHVAVVGIKIVIIYTKQEAPEQLCLPWSKQRSQDKKVHDIFSKPVQFLGKTH